MLIPRAIYSSLTNWRHNISSYLLFRQVLPGTRELIFALYGWLAPFFFGLGHAKSYIVLINDGLAVIEQPQLFGENDIPVPVLYAAGSSGQGGLMLEGHGHHNGRALTSGRLALKKRRKRSVTKKLIFLITRDELREINRFSFGDRNFLGITIFSRRIYSHLGNQMRTPSRVVGRWI